MPQPAGSSRTRSPSSQQPYPPPPSPPRATPTLASLRLPPGPCPLRPGAPSFPVAHVLLIRPTLPPSPTSEGLGQLRGA